MGYAIIKVSKNGTITLPKEFRRKYSIKENDYVKVEDSKDGIRIVGTEVIEMPPKIRELQKIASEKKIAVKHIVKSVKKVRPTVYEEEYGA